LVALEHQWKPECIFFKVFVGVENRQKH
jgi:hypothetical protein